VARTYDQKRSEMMSIEQLRATANVDALRQAVAVAQWTVGDTVAQLGGTRNTATALLRDRGVATPTKSEIVSQQRSINRWLNFERGSGKQARRPSADNRAALNRVGRNQKLAKDGFSIKMNGEIAVQGYKRNRTAAVDLIGDQALAFLNDPNYGVLGEAYLGDADSLYGFGDDLSVDLIAE
jgi:hypothetical protein